MTLLKRLLELAEEETNAQVLTLIEAPERHQFHIGEMLLVHPGGITEGILVNEFFTQVLMQKLQEQEYNKPDIVSIIYEEKTYRVFRNLVGAGKYKAIILGGGHISQPLGQMLAMLDFDVTVVDDRPDFANCNRFPWAQQVICNSFEQALAALDLDEKTAVIIVTRGHRHDLACLRSVLKGKALYVGMIGSRRKVQAALTVLKEEGVDILRLKQVYAPIGLEIGAESPAEIAVSIVAEVLAAFRGGSCLPLRDKERSSHG